jgi:glycosyltransferase involved in cell wall biosynthesis
LSEKRKVVIATPTRERPTAAYLAALEASVPALDAAGLHHMTSFRAGSPYISHSRSEMLRKAMNLPADVVVFIDDDMSWTPEALIRLIETPGDVISGLYRFKTEAEEYMGAVRPSADMKPIQRDDGCVLMDWVPAGFLKITKQAVDRFMRAYPELCYGPKFSLSVDLFNHGAHDGLWWGEDYAFSRRWNAMGEEIWVVPDLDLTHHGSEQAYPGNYAAYLRRQPGGSEDPARAPDRQQSAA